MPLVRDYTDSELINLLSDKAEILFARLLTKADRDGNYIADPALLKSNCFPRKDYRIAQISTWLKELATEHTVGTSKKPTALLRIYEVNGKQYLHIYKFGQKHNAKPIYPPPQFLPPDPEEKRREEEFKLELKIEGNGKDAPAFFIKENIVKELREFLLSHSKLYYPKQNEICSKAIWNWQQKKNIQHDTVFDDALKKEFAAIEEKLYQNHLYPHINKDISEMWTHYETRNFQIPNGNILMPITNFTSVMKGWQKQKVKFEKKVA